MSPLAKIHCRLAFVTSSGGLFYFVQHNLPSGVKKLYFCHSTFLLRVFTQIRLKYGCTFR